ncbi:apolipoprotein N-acyltransferase [Thiomicrorhabdus lithotrophica]|uniref:Apolipoprotein N-acyltransferase n=1 Tax=Thiomicrorhabdus lithotrophica TaxID=2949997 RepID=A0ABY8CC56_9GAMM|nr:apolipoprotein N-acyltransferase [Thiomicrorhabdus lithotrophica]WEJ62250.1 apolipoprotein N-acyltransferase [Thiomicrorhabdus lithotrophica]
MKSVFNFLKNVFVPAKKHGLALLLGAMSVFAFAPFEVSPLMLAAIAGLFMLWLDAKSRFEAAKIGLWFGLGQFGLGVSWLFSSMYFYSGVALPFAVILTAGFVLFLSLSVAIGGWLAHYFKNPNRPGLVLTLLFPAVWVLIELIRSTIFGGFPFLLSGTTHLHTWLDGFAPVFGVWGVSWAVAISAGLLLWLFKQKSWVAASMSLCLIWSLGGLLQQVEWVKPIAKPIDVALIQGNIPQEEKWLPNAFYPTLKTYIGLTKQNMDADVVVWPETAIPAYYDVVEKGALLGFIKDAKLLNTDILVGVIAGGANSEHYYNALINVHNPEDRYYKKHLVPFSEFFPFTSAFAFVSGLFDIPFATFTHGPSDQKPINLGGQDAGLSICYEMAFGEELAAQLPQAKYLITVSNDAWFAGTFEPAQQLQEVQMRALELGREIARSTNTGYTAIVDIKGNIKQQIPAYEEGVLRGKVQPYEGLTFYAEWKKMPILFLLFTYFGFLLAKRYFLRGRF